MPLQAPDSIAASSASFGYFYALDYLQLMSPLEVLIEEVIKYKSNAQRESLGFAFSLRQASQLRNFLHGKAKAKAAPNRYLNIQTGSDGSQKHFVSSFEVAIETGYKIVVISPFFFSYTASTRSDMRELKNIRKVHGRSRLPICVSFPYTNKKLVNAFSKAKGWKFSFMSYAGNVLKSIASLAHRSLPDSEIFIRRARLKQDIGAIYRLEIQAFKNEKQSVLSRFGFPSKKAWLAEYAKRKNTSYVATKGKKIVGYVQGRFK